MTRDRGYRLGVDVGGTFTDLVLAAPDGRALTRKVLSSAANYAEAIIEGAAALLAEASLEPGAVAEIIHGTTVATNAILERRGARTGLLTTAGFRDLLEIGRLRLARLYDLDFERSAPLVPRRWRLEVGERMSHAGAVIAPLDATSATRGHRSAARRGRRVHRRVLPARLCQCGARAGRRRPRAGAGARRGADAVVRDPAGDARVRADEHHRHQCLRHAGDGAVSRIARARAGAARPRRAAPRHAVERRRDDRRGRPPPAGARDRVGPRRRRHRHRGAGPAHRPRQRDQHRHGRDDGQGLGHRGRRHQAHRRVRDRREHVAGEPALQGRRLSCCACPPSTSPRWARAAAAS